MATKDIRRQHHEYGISYTDMDHDRRRNGIVRLYQKIDKYQALHRDVLAWLCNKREI